MLSKPMSKDRQIVLMLLLRKRLAKRSWLIWQKRSEDGDALCCDIAGNEFTRYTEASNSAELARRILYEGSDDMLKRIEETRRMR